MPQNLADKATPCQVFQKVELSLLVKEAVQVVPEGVWLQLLPTDKVQLKLQLYKLSSQKPSGTDDLQLESCGEHLLSGGQSYTLCSSQFFQLHVDGGSNDASKIAGLAEFSTIPNLYFNKKFNHSNGLGQPHSEVAYFKAYYSHLHPEFGQRSLQVLDLGCGRGRNAVVFAGDSEHDFQVLGLDQSVESLATWNAMSAAEGLADSGKLVSQQVNLNSWREAVPHDISMAIVSLQFLQAEAAVELLQHCSAQARPGALHLSVFPIASDHPAINWPGGFHFLPQSEEVKQLFMQWGWSILEYRESYGHLGKVGSTDGLPIRGLFATLIAQNAF